MRDEHLHPQRGWTLLRNAGQATPDEISHLKSCQECTDWLSLFADLALNAGAQFDLDTRFILEVTPHLAPERGAALIRNGGTLSPTEHGHLLRCCVCNAWLSDHAAIARRAGFPVAFEIPPWDRSE